MNKEFTTLNVSLESESHVYTWKQFGTPRMIFLWLLMGVIWLYILYLWKYIRGDFLTIGSFGLAIIAFLYNSVLKTSVEINSEKLSTIKTPFNLFAKSLKLEEVSRVYCEKSILEKYCVRAELKNGKCIKLLYGLKEKQAIELAQYIDNSRKHFQQMRLISTGKGITYFGD